ncbi:hypothetical protein HY625_00125 [Candidatus Uhrbacteria bacterium]|nr:hypothetical protein [Candidatus Uhrbacteria bacterium]
MEKSKNGNGNGNGNGKDVVYANVYSRRGPHHESILALTPATQIVHVNGRATLLVVRAILEHAPHVQCIEIIPRVMPSVSAQARAFCRQHSITITPGHFNPNLVWNETRSRWFHQKQKFFRDLQGETKKRWEELLFLEISAALLTERYFCLHGEEFLPQDVLAAQYGFSQGSYCVNGVIFYLNPRAPAGATAKVIARSIGRLVEKLRPHSQFLQARRRIEKEFGAAVIPENIALAGIPDFEIALRARKDGRLGLLETHDPKAYCALALRFGLDETPHCYRTYQEVVRVMVGRSPQHAHQLVRRALKKLRVPSL